MNKHYIYIPYEKKEIVRELKGRWDANKKLWYFVDSIPPQLSKYRNPPLNIYYEIPYSERERAKQYGGRWDPDRKLWYIKSYNDDFRDKFSEYLSVEKDELECETKEHIRHTIPYFDTLRNSHMYL